MPADEETSRDAWRAFDGGRSIGATGSEGGVIVRDEEHREGARITLERDAGAALFAITCGVYGWLVHTRFFGAPSEAASAFEAMRVGLEEIVGLLPAAVAPGDAFPEVVEALRCFLARFP